MPVLSTLRKNSLDYQRSLHESEKIRTRVADEQKRLDELLRFWTQKRDDTHTYAGGGDQEHSDYTLERIRCNEFFSKTPAQKKAFPYFNHPYEVSRHYLNYDREYGTRELSPLFFKMIAEHLGYLSPTAREMAYGKFGYMSLGFPVEGVHPPYGAWPDARPLTKAEKGRLYDAQTDLHARLVHVDVMGKMRAKPYDFEDGQTTEACYDAVKLLFDGPHATRVEKSQIPPKTWIWPFFGLGQKMNLETGMWHKVRPIANEKLRNSQTSPLVEHMTLPGTPTIVDMVGYAANPTLATTLLQTKDDVTDTITKNRKGTEEGKMRWKDASRLEKPLPPYEGVSFVPCFGKLDLYQAYMQLAVRHPSRNYFQVYNPKTKKYEFGRLNVMSFGNIHSVFGFVGSVSEFLNTMINQMMKIPCTVYVDDIIFMCAEDLLPVYMDAIRRMLALCGIAVEPKKCEVAKKGEPIELLGLNFTSLEEEVEVALSEKKIAQVETKTKELWGILDSFEHYKGNQTPDVVQDAYGCLEELNGLFIHCTYWRNVKRGVPLAGHVYRLLSKKPQFPSKIRSITCRKMIRALAKKMLHEVQRRTPMKIKKSTNVKGRIHVMTDASMSGTEVAMGGIIFLPDGTSQGFSIYLQQKDLPHVLQRQNILIYELVAVYMAQILFRDLLQETSAVMHCDNAGACYGIVKGQLENATATAVVAAIGDYNMQTDVYNFYAYINTHDNAADATTRVKMLDQLAATYGTQFLLTREQVFEVVTQIAKEVKDIASDYLL